MHDRSRVVKLKLTLRTLCVMWVRVGLSPKALTSNKMFHPPGSSVRIDGNRPRRLIHRQSQIQGYPTNQWLYTAGYFITCKCLTTRKRSIDWGNLQLGCGIRVIHKNKCGTFYFLDLPQINIGVTVMSIVTVTTTTIVKILSQLHLVALCTFGHVKALRQRDKMRTCVWLILPCIRTQVSAHK